MRISTLLVSPPVTQDLGAAPYQLEPSIYLPPEEIYGSQKGIISWRQSSISFRDNRLTPFINDSHDVGKVVLGVLDRTLTLESGGPLLGLVKRSNLQSNKVQVRPTFLEQVGIVSANSLRHEPPSHGDQNANSSIGSISCFQIDSPNRTLTFLTRPRNGSKPSSLIPESAKNVLPMVDLRPLGDFVEHYACRVSKVIIESAKLKYPKVITPPKSLASGTRQVRDIVAVLFDTGLTGCCLTTELWNFLKSPALDTKDESNEGLDPKTITSVRVFIQVFPKELNKNLAPKGTNEDLFEIQSNEQCNPFFDVSPISLDWFDDESISPHVIVLGQTFLIQGSLTIDIDDRKLTFVKG